MFYHRILTIVYTLMFASVLNGQNYIDEVTTYSKLKYKGTIVEQKLGEHIKILVLNTKDTVTLKMDEVDEIVKIIEPQQIVKKRKNDTSPNKNVFNQNFFSPEVHFLLGGGDVATSGIGISLFYRKNERVQLGVTVLYQGETSQTLRRPYQWQKIPIIADFQYDLQKYMSGRSALFGRMGLGYSLTLNGDYYDEFSGMNMSVTNGFVISPGLGFRFNVLKNTGIKVELGYQLILDKTKEEKNLTIENHKWNSVFAKGSLFF